MSTGVCFDRLRDRERFCGFGRCATHDCFGFWSVEGYDGCWYEKIGYVYAGFTE